MSKSDGIVEKYHFASDNTAGVAPQAWAAVEKANSGYVPSYGEDPWTQRAADLIRKVFEADCEVFFTFNGTAANSLALASMCQSYHSVLCHELAHIETDECGAPEFYSNGSKLLSVGGENGKVEIEAIKYHVERRSDIHYPKPKVLSITQPTELGTVYTVDELQALAELARNLSLRLHVDGARFANAVAALKVSPATITRQCGVDVLCLGGTKLGMPVGDAVVFFDKKLAWEFDYRCKQAGQLASKMRFLAAPWVGMLEGDAWLEHARHANECALRLATELTKFPDIELAAPVEANGVFVHLPNRVHAHLRDRGWRYYTFIGRGCTRLMCSWKTSESDIEAFVDDVSSCYTV
jgi:threonine aldolase